LFVVRSLHKDLLDIGSHVYIGMVNLLNVSRE
jgi:hypothetical protein